MGNFSWVELARMFEHDFYATVQVCTIFLAKSGLRGPAKNLPAAELIQTSFYGTVIDHFLGGAETAALAPCPRLDFRRIWCVAGRGLFCRNQLGVF